MISDTALREFKEAWQAEFGVAIPDNVALEEATALLTVMNAVYRPLKQFDVDEYENGTHIPISE